MTWGTQTDCDRRLREENRRLQDEIVRQRDDERHKEQEQDAEREQSQRDLMDEREARLRCATDWPTAFRNGMFLFQREAAQECRDNSWMAAHIAEHPEDTADPHLQPTTYFIDMPDKIRRAEAIYNQEMEVVELQIADLRIKALFAISNRVREFDDELADALRDNMPDYLTDW